VLNSAEFVFLYLNSFNSRFATFLATFQAQVYFSQISAAPLCGEILESAQIQFGTFMVDINYKVSKKKIQEV